MLVLTVTSDRISNVLSMNTGDMKIVLKISLLFFLIAPVNADSLLKDIIAGFEDSNIEFQRGKSYVPFFPLAILGAKSYDSFEVELGDSLNLEYDVDHFVQNANLPILINDNNALIIGEYLARTTFSYADEQSDAYARSFSVDSVGIPIAWLSQLQPNWQAGGFVMPMAHKTSHKNAGWSWEYLGGAFGRYVQSDNLWWAFGAYVNVAPGEDTYLPYLGASWALNEHWSLSAIMPWPAILYAPNDDWLVRLGAAPSGASWQLEAESGELLSSGDSTQLIAAQAYEPSDASINFDAWDFGLSLERRLAGNFWLGAEAGIGGLRGLRISGGDWHGADTQVSSSAYIGLNINFRPSTR